MRKTSLFFLLFIVITIIVVGCQDRQKEPEMGQERKDEIEALEVDKDEIENGKSLKVELVDQEGIQVGIATLTEEADGVHIAVDAHHLPEGLHGFHVHEKGICETPDFDSAGGHFNPDEKNHGFDDSKGPHAGDMMNLEVQADGTIEQLIINDRITLKKGKTHSLFNQEGTSLIVHADPDDNVSQPAGNAGERIVCGVIYKGENEESMR